jgi:TonB-linked SusC/RagA family outer membrane protein
MLLILHQKKPPVKAATSFNPQISKLMKLIPLFILIGLLQAGAKGLSQKLSLSEKNAPLSAVLKKIEKKTGFTFLYEDRVLEKADMVTVIGKNLSLDQVLSLCFEDQPLTYKIFSKTVVIKEKDPPVSGQGFLSPPPPPPPPVAGVVRDSAGAPIAGASVMIKGTTKGTTTNTSGVFSINAQKGDVLIVNSIGYQMQEVTVTDEGSMSITLKAKISDLDQAVVIGYGTQKRRDVTGAVASVKAADLDLSTSTNFLQSMQGKTTGIQVVQATGQPGAGVTIQIRSNPSKADPGTLYVIDGLIVNNSAGTPGNAQYGIGGVDQSPLNFINPNDIESIDILKDASSRAIYGAQAGGGVVLITTKRGKTGKPTVKYSVSDGIQTAQRMYKVLGTKDYMIQRNLFGLEKWKLSNSVGPYYGTVDMNSLPAFAPFYTQQQIDTTAAEPNAIDAITRQGFTLQHNLSISASNGKTSYFISGNYFDQKGVILGSDYKRWNGSVNLDQVISDKIKVGIVLIGSNSSSTNLVTGGVSENSGILTAALQYPANMPLQLPDGSYPVNPLYPSQPNPLSFTTINDQLLNHRLLTSTYGTWKVIDGLTARAAFSYDQSTSKRNSYFPTTFSYGANVGGLAEIGDNYSNTKQIDYSLNYNHPIAENQSLDAIIGYNYQLSTSGGVSAANQNFASDAISYYNLGAGQSPKPSVGSSQGQSTNASYYARAIYQLDNKYTVQASMTRNGSSLFALNHKWGYFPAVSAGWLVSNEKFMQKSKVINFLKLRVGYGETGNANFPATAFEIYNLSGSPNFGNPGSVSTAISLTQAANPDLKWETVGELNIGLDFALLTNRLSGSVDYFNKTISNLINYVPFPADFTVGGVYSNSGTTKSTGYEIGLQSKNIVTGAKGGFTWSSSVNFSHYLSYWTKRSPQSIATLAKYVAVSGKSALFNGNYGYLASGGLFTGNHGAAPAAMPGMLPGGIILKDLHGYDANGKLTGPDGTITTADQTLLNNNDPKFNIGVGNTFGYRNFDLNIFFSGLVQKKASASVAGSYSAQDQAMVTFGMNSIPSVKQSWSSQNPGNKLPTAMSDVNYRSYQAASSYYIVDASFLRCQNITLGYSFPASVFKKQNIVSGLRLSLDVQNAFIITNYKYMDPMLNQGNFYPLSRSFVFGANLTL